MKPIHLNSIYKYSSYLKSRYYDFLKDDLEKSFGDHLAFHHSDGSVTVLHNDGSIARQIDLIEGGTHPSDSLADQVSQLDRRMDMRLESITRRLDRLDSRPISGSVAYSSAAASREPREPTSAIIAHYAGGAIHHPDSNVGRWPAKAHQVACDDPNAVGMSVAQAACDDRNAVGMGVAQAACDDRNAFAVSLAQAAYHAGGAAG
jgi:hypothetical protein